MNTLHILSAILLVVTASPVSLASSNLAPAENTRQLQSAVGADRDTYFPGEAAIFTVTVTNPGQSALAVPEPLTGKNSCFTLRKGDQRGALLPVVAGPICPTHSDMETPAITLLGSGEQRQGRVSADLLTYGLAESGGTSRLSAPGRYLLEYLYYDLHSTVGFQVVLPHLDADTVMRLRDISYTDPDTGKPVHVAAYAHAFALRWKGETYICVSQGPGKNGNTLTADARGDFAGGDFPYLRIASTPDPVTSIMITSDPHNRLIVSWQDAKNVWGSRMLLSYPLDPVRAVTQVRTDSTAEALNAAQSRVAMADRTGLSSAGLK